jgi:pyrimidine-nucleoside phosphorylase
MMNPQDLIRKKRDGARFTSDEISAFIRGVCDETWADYQISALIMAMFINGMNQTEQNSLVKAMLHSGKVLDFSDVNQPKADKHSTGGVGDKTSILIAPLAAACGLAVPMISGRGLGHTGGTLDKLESIPKYNVNLSEKEFHKILKKCGMALSGQTADIVPADKKIYALRDATATVDSIPLIVASIMSKKLAEGLDALVLDVKTGTGAFMESELEAQELAKALCRTGHEFGLKTEAIISDMNQPLGKFVGNACEIYECIKILRGEIEDGMQPTLDLSIELTARMLVLSNITDDLDDAKFRVEDVLENGTALEKFKQNIKLQKGNPKVCDKPEMLLEKDLIEVKIKSPEAGFVNEIDTKAIGEAVCGIGGGRVQMSDTIDFAVGYACEKKLGEMVKNHETLGTLYCRTEAQAAKVLAKLQMAYKITEEPNVRKFELIKDVISVGS